MFSPESPPPPVPPEPPVEGSCCGCGCENCVWVYYREAQRRYDAADAEWRQRYGHLE